MTDAERQPGPPQRWRSAEAFQGFLAYMDEFWRSPQGRRLHAAQQAAEADLQAWLVDQPGIVVGRHGGQVPEQWEGEVDGHNFYFRERGGEWDIEIDLCPRDGSTRGEGDVVATGTIAAEGYGDSPRERAAFIDTTIRDHLRRKQVAEIAATVNERSTELNRRLS